MHAANLYSQIHEKEIPKNLIPLLISQQRVSRKHGHFKFEALSCRTHVKHDTSIFYVPFRICHVDVSYRIVPVSVQHRKECNNKKQKWEA